MPLNAARTRSDKRSVSVMGDLPGWLWGRAGKATVAGRRRGVESCSGPVHQVVDNDATRVLESRLNQVATGTASVGTTGCAVRAFLAPEDRAPRSSVVATMAHD